MTQDYINQSVNNTSHALAFPDTSTEHNIITKQLAAFPHESLLHLVV